MSKQRTISAYTPSNTDPETRERIFVQRHQLLRRVVGWCEESMLTGNKHHLLFIGPRGSGKTHLVAMVYDRLARNSDLSDKMRIAWLGEDSVFTGLIDVALEIADELSNEYPDEFQFDYRDKARTLSADDAARFILNEIVSRLGDKSILLIMENLNRAFHGLGDLGQKKWRAFLQEHGRVATLATSQQLFEDISSRDAAFYGFFEIVHLEPLSVDDARELMEKIARENDKQDLVQFLATPAGRYRVRALHHLAGGNHRMYVMLSEFLTRESLDGLVASFEELAEDLTPYFQERVRSLSRQQARIVQSLCNATGAMTVKEVAQDTFIPERNVSKQLGDLKQRRYVVSEKRGKESFYEMAEPLMRLCLEVKKQRGKPLKLVAAFLRAWFSEESLRGGLEVKSGMSGRHARSLAYKRIALQSEDTFRQVIGAKLAREFQSNMDNMRLDDAMHVAEELVYADRPMGLIRRSQVLRKKGQLVQALKGIDDAIALHGLSASQEAEALRNRAIIYGELGESQKAIADYSSMIEMEETPVDRKVVALCSRGGIYSKLGELEKALADYSDVIEMEGVPAKLKAMAFFDRGVTFGELGESEKELADYTAVIEIKEAPLDQKTRALVNRGVSYGELGEPDKAMADFSAVIETREPCADQKAAALVNRGLAYGALGESEKAIADYSTVIQMGEAPVDRRASAFFARGVMYGVLGESRKEMADYSTVTEMREAPIQLKAKSMTTRGVRHLQSQHFELSVNDFRAVVDMPGVSSSARTGALFCMPEAMIPIKPPNESVKSIQRAFDEGDPETIEYGGTPTDIIQMIMGREHHSWSEFIEKLIPVYAKYGALSSLGSGLTESIATLDDGDYSESQLDLWKSSWREFGAKHEELSIGLSALDAAVRVIKNGNDRPLFDLPLEIRELVRPLLKNTLSKE